MNEFPEKDGKDYAHGATKVVLNLIPMVGGSLSATFETIFSSPLDKRKEEWLKQLAQTVEELCKKVEGLTPEKLGDDSEFISFYLQASNIALRTHDRVKLKALNTTVKNCVLLKDIDESKKMIFLRILDQITPLHFKVFEFFSNYGVHLVEYSKNHSGFQTSVKSGMSKGRIYDVWDSLNIGVSLDEPLIGIIINDLKNYGFLSENFNFFTVDEPFSQIAINKSSTTAFGKDFIRFINE